MLHIAVLSDTHLDSPTPRLTEEFETWLRDMDAVLHCGDHTGEALWAYLNGHPAFHAVRGNMDADFGEGLLPVKRVLHLGGFRVGLLHGDGLGPTDPGRHVTDIFGEELDLVCCGHTHRRELRKAGAVTVLNPGSFRVPKGNCSPGDAVLDLDPQSGISVQWKDV